MTLDELFNNTIAGSSSPLAVLTISSGITQGVYRMPLTVVAIPPPPPGSFQVEHKQQLRAFADLLVTSNENRQLLLTITRTLHPVLLQPVTGSFHVSVDITDLIRGHHEVVTNVSAFAAPTDGPAVRPCQTASAYFQSLEPSNQLVHCCIFGNG